MSTSNALPESTEQKLITQLIREGQAESEDYDYYSAMAALDSVYDEPDADETVRALLERYNATR